MSIKIYRVEIKDSVRAIKKQQKLRNYELLRPLGMKD